MLKIKSQSDFHLNGKNRYLVINQQKKFKNESKSYYYVKYPSKSVENLTKTNQSDAKTFENSFSRNFVKNQEQFTDADKYKYNRQINSNAKENIPIPTRLQPIEKETNQQSKSNAYEPFKLSKSPENVISPIKSQSTNQAKKFSMDTKTNQYVNNLFDRDQDQDTVFLEACSYYESQLERTSTPLKPEIDNTDLTNRKDIVKEIGNLSLILDGYESLKISFADKSDSLSEKLTVIFFDLENEIKTAIGKNDLKSLSKALMIKNLHRLSVKLVGKYFIDLGFEEKTRLEVESNRFFNVQLLNEQDKSYLRLTEKNGEIVININGVYQLTATDFIKTYFKRLLEKRLRKNFKIVNLYMVIPQAFGSLQRKTVKDCFAELCLNCFIITRPLIGAAISDLSLNSPINGTKFIFDMTLDTMDATIVKTYRKSSSFTVYKVSCNVGDISLGLEDIDERLANHILTHQGENEIDIVSLMSLIGPLKRTLIERNIATLNLVEPNHQKAIEISVDLVKNDICKDIYDWSLLHIKRCLKEANLDISQIDSMLFLFDEVKLPGFSNFFKEKFPNHCSLRFINESEISLASLKLGVKQRLKRLKIEEILPRSIGLGLYNGSVNFLIPRNTPLPFKREFAISNTYEFDFYEGERPHIKYCKYIGKVKLKKQPGIYSNTSGVIFIDNEGILHLKHLSQTESPIWIDNNIVKLTDVNTENLELDPIEADRFRKQDIVLNRALNDLDSFLNGLKLKFIKNSEITEKIQSTKKRIKSNRLTMNVEQCQKIKKELEEQINLLQG